MTPVLTSRPPHRAHPNHPANQRYPRSAWPAAQGHLGYQTMDHLPVNRGFKQHCGFLGGSESYHDGGGSANATDGKHDLWHDTTPAIDLIGSFEYATNYYTQQAVAIIEDHMAAAVAPAAAPLSPFFLYFAIQNVHSPYVGAVLWSLWGLGRAEASCTARGSRRRAAEQPRR